MLHSLRAHVLPRWIVQSSQNLHASRSSSSFKFSRRRATSAAVIFTVTSTTVLAANNHQDNNAAAAAPTHCSNQRRSSALSLAATSSNMFSFNTTTTECEGAAPETAAAAAATTTTTATISDYLLKFDHYNGVIVHLDWIFHHPNATSADNAKQQQQVEALYHEWSQHPEKFEAVLQRSLQQWKSEGRKGIWIHLPKNMASLVPICVSQGFDFHSCQNHNRINAATNDRGSTTLILSQWLPTDVVSRLPLGPYFQAGVGCVVLHPDDPTKMLVVKEITGPAAARNLWKMPTGLIDPGEDIAEAAVRELEEETGLIGATCQGVLAFRQAHGASAGRAASDLFFVVLLSAPQHSSLVDNLKPQEHEIAAIQWMPVKEYANQEVWLKSPVYLELNQAIIDASANQKLGKPTPVVVPHKLDVGWLSGTNTVYRSNL